MSSYVEVCVCVRACIEVRQRASKKHPYTLGTHRVVMRTFSNPKSHLVACVSS